MARSRNTGIILALVIVGFGSSAALIASSKPQTEPEETLAYIGDVFRSAVGSPPGLGWLLSDGTVVTEENAQEITVLAATPKVVVAPLKSIVAAESSVQFIEAHHVACNFLNESRPLQLSIYSANLPQQKPNPQVFVLQRPFPGLTAGYREFQPTKSAMAEMWKRLQPKSPGQLRKSYSVTQGDLDVFFTFAALYDGTKQGMSKSGIFLQRLDGTIVGAELSEISAVFEQTACDGCRVPTYKEPLQGHVMNLFRASAFAYPVLMLDTSTAEGRAISLTTFTDKGQLADYRMYEYVVTCR